MELAGVDIGGLAVSDQRLIARYGLGAWMDALVKKARGNAPMAHPSRAKERKVRHECVVCSEGFYSRRKDARFCGINCRVVASRQQAKM